MAALIILVAVAVLVAFAGASLTWGVDSRDTIQDDHHR